MNIELQQICCGYNGRDVINGVSLEIGPGEIVCLLGPNGSGKTTLFKALLGLVPLRSGAALLDAVRSEWPEVVRVDVALPGDGAPAGPPKRLTAEAVKAEVAEVVAAVGVGEVGWAVGQDAVPAAAAGPCPKRPRHRII